DLPALDHLLDLVLAAQPRCAVGHFLHHVGAADGLDHLLFLAVAAVVGDLLDGSGLVVGVAVLLGLVLPGRVVLGGGRGRFRVDHLGFEGSGCDLHRVGRFGLAGGRSGRNRLVRRMLRRARGRLRQCDRLDRGLGGDVARCGLARRALVRLAVRALGTVVLDRLAVDRLLALSLGSAPVAWMTVAAIAAAGAAVRFRLGVAMGALFLLDQRLPIGDRDLVVVGMDFAEGEEAVAIAAVV